MQNNNIISIAAIVVSLTAIVIFFKGGSADKLKNKNTVDHVDNADGRILFWEIYPELVITTEGEKINEQAVILDQFDNKIAFSELLKVTKSQNLLIFRFSAYDCDLCIKSTLPLLKDYINKFPENIKVVVDGMTARDFRIKYKELQKDIFWEKTIFFLEQENFGLSLENKNIPFFLVVNKGSKLINRVFLPDKLYPQQTIVYLDKVMASLKHD